MQKDLLEQIDRLIRQRPPSKEILESYREVAKLMVEAEPQAPPLELDRQQVEVKTKNGFPLFARDELPLDLDEAKALLRKILAHLSGKERPDREGLKKALAKVEKTPGWAENLFRAALEKEGKTLSELAEETGLNQETILFLSMTALKPSIYALRATLEGNAEDRNWDHGYCPICGSQPDMAFFDKSGKRHLHCELCGEEWRYARMKCPFCGNTDHQTLGYFSSEQEEGYRVDVCRKCKRYLKTVDKRAFEDPAPMDLEHLATIHLDLLAQEQGFE